MSTSRLLQQWDETIRPTRQLPVSKVWRGGIGLSLIVDGKPRRFVRNEDMRFLALRDVPPGHFPGDHVLNGRPVQYANLGRAQLQYGTARVDLTSDPGFDFGLRPFNVSRRKDGTVVVAGNHGDANLFDEVSVNTLNASERSVFRAALLASQSMTWWARYGRMPKGDPLRKPWSVEAQTPVPARGADLPQPLVGLPYHHAERAFDALTISDQTPNSLPCSKCGKSSAVEEFTPDRITKFFDDGDFKADCPKCGRTTRFRLDEMESGRVRRNYPKQFREQFVEALAHGLPLYAVGKMEYAGIRDTGPDDNVRIHVFKVNGQNWYYELPRHVEVEARVGETVRPGQRLVRRVVEIPNKKWQDQDATRRWKTVGKLKLGMDLSQLQRLFFEQYLRSIPDSNLVYVPTWLMAGNTSLQGQDLVWDLKGLQVDKFGVVPLKPVWQRKWDHLRHELLGRVDLDARIDDPRFSLMAGRTRRKARKSGKVRRKKAIG